MRYLKAILVFTPFILAGCIVIPTYTAKISLQPNETNLRQNPVRNVLLIGTGTVASRVFFENLFTQIDFSLKQKNTVSDFVYVGRSSKSPIQLIDSLRKDKHDAYLVFKTTKTAALDMTHAHYIAAGPGVSTTGYGNRYVETFEVKMYSTKEKAHIIWQGDLSVDFDLAHSNRYREISKLIMNEFQKNGITQ